DSFSIGVSADNFKINWLFRSKSKDLLTAPLVERVVSINGLVLSPSVLHQEGFFPRFLESGNISLIPSRLRRFEKTLTSLLYLSTERMGPQETFGAEAGFLDEV